MRNILALAALATATACAPFWGKLDRTSRAWFSPLAGSDETQPVAAGAEIYARNCAYCHGDGGHGDGALGKDLPVAPADLTVLTAGNGGTFPAERVLEAIHGYPGKFHRGSMPEFVHELSGPVVEWRSPEGEVIMTPKGLMDVVAYVESLQAESDG